MKKVLIVIPAYNIGGTNKSLSNLMEFIDKKKFVVEIFSIVNKGVYRNEFSKYNIVRKSFLLTAIYQMKDSILTENIFSILCKMVIKIVYRLLIKMFGSKIKEMLIEKEVKVFNQKKYDTVIAMQEGLATEFVEFIDSPNKIAWIHSIYEMRKKNHNINEHSLYSSYNNIICVSEYSKTNFLGYYPDLRNKCIALHNLVDAKSIVKLSKNNKNIDTRFKTDKFTIISVGRLNEVKQFDLIPSIGKTLKGNGCRFSWYIIGDGEEETNISEAIKYNNIGENIIMLGSKINPYPYFATADLIVCTSKSESCPNVVNEGKILHKIVLTTNYPSAKELIDNGVNGYIVEENELANQITQIIKSDNKDMLDVLSDYKYRNEDILGKVESLI